jgi:hypothetical protein
MPDAARALVGGGDGCPCICVLMAPASRSAGTPAAAALNEAAPDSVRLGLFDLPRRNVEMAPSDGDTVFGAHRRAPGLRSLLMVVAADGTDSAEAHAAGGPSPTGGPPGRAAGAARCLPRRLRPGVAP